MNNETAELGFRYVLKPDDTFASWLVRNCKNEQELRENIIGSLEQVDPLLESDIEQAYAVLADGEEVPSVDLVLEQAQRTTVEDLVKELMPRLDRYHKKYNFVIELEGIGHTGQVFLFGNEIKLEESLKYERISNLGFAWGKIGAPCQQLAFAICLEIMGQDKAKEVYMDFCHKHLLKLTAFDDFKIEVQLNY